MGVDDFDGAQPHWPDDGTVMRDVPGFFECPECGRQVSVPWVPMPPEFEGPDIDQRR